jgi:hypothetical protein
MESFFIPSCLCLMGLVQSNSTKKILLSTSHPGCTFPFKSTNDLCHSQGTCFGGSCCASTCCCPRGTSPKLPHLQTPTLNRAPTLTHNFFLTLCCKYTVHCTRPEWRCLSDGKFFYFIWDMFPRLSLHCRIREPEEPGP